MLLSGVQVENRHVLQIAGLVEGSLGSKLVTAYRLRVSVGALSYREREAILAALDTAPALRDLRDALVANGAWQIPAGQPR